MDKKLKIAFFDTKRYDKKSFDLKNDNLEIEYFESKLTPKTVELAKGFDAVCAFVNDTLNKEVIETLASFGIKLIAMRSAGYNNVDIQAAKENGITVVRVPAYSPYAVAEHAMALLLTAVRKTHRAYNRTREFNFSLEGLTGFDLHGKTVGVIGTGKIGQIFINICKGFGMNILAYDPFPANIEGIKYVDLDTLYKESDIISLHCPLFKENRHMINTDAISKMKTGVVIINTSRGALIDSEALLDGILSRKIHKVGLDVYEEETKYFFEDRSGHIMDDETLARLATLPNVIITSHQAFFTYEALSNIAETTIKNIHEFFEHPERSEHINMVK